MSTTHIAYNPQLSLICLIVLYSYFAVYKYGQDHNIEFMMSLGFAFILVFIVMIMAALLTMAKQPLDYDHKRAKKKKK